MAAFVALTGFMGSGKTSVGSAVAARLGWRFVDLDEEFVRSGPGSITDFFATKGEAAFRQEESGLLARVLADEQSRSGGLVVALGGGTLESPAAIDLLRNRGGVVLLDVQPDEAWARVEGSERPLATEPETFKTLWQRRRETYQRCADVVVPVCGRGIDEVARDVVNIVGTLGRHWGSSWARPLVSTQRPSLVLGGEGVLDVLADRATLAREAGKRLLIITDRNVAEAWGGRVLSLLGADPSEDVRVVEPGETSKSVRSLEGCWEWLAARGARRDDIVVAFGGGMIGDLAGLAAGTYQRGVSLWQVPTSLLAQVDSSVGGKTAVNLAAGKNLVGAFYQPDLVVIEPDMLQTLPDVEFVSGLGEVVKYALLQSSEAFDSLERAAETIANKDAAALAGVAKTDVNFKAGVVDDDERERGRRAILNLGHTTAHALEVTGGYGNLRHGHAVALGLLVALAVSEACLGLDSQVRVRTRRLLETFALPTRVRLPSIESLFAAMAHDKKVTAGGSGFVGLKAMGEPVWGMDVSRQVLADALEVIGA